MKLCMKCMEIYHKSLNTDRCPKLHCHGNVEEIDELMLPVIMKLNQKGYTTNFCCQGHITEFYNIIDMYIVFDDDVYESLVANNPKSPTGWFYINTSLRPLEEKDVDKCLEMVKFTMSDFLGEYRTKHNQIIRLMSSLYDWIEKLK